jgi:hypothetical protein
MLFPLIAVLSVRRGTPGAEPARLKAALKERRRAEYRFDDQFICSYGFKSPMSRFYFDLFLGSDFSRDEVGSEVGSLRAAEIEVMRTAADLTRDRLLRMQSAAPDAIRIEMTDERRQPVLTVTVSVQVERAGPMPDMDRSSLSVERLTKAAEYRRQAQEIRTIAERIAINEAREQLLETADHLEELAQEEERKAHDDSSRRQPRSEA